MILFMVKGKPKENENIIIPFEYPTDKAKIITSKDANFLSWNEVSYKHEENTIKIENLATLKQVIFYVAKKDALCKDIVNQFNKRYRMDIFTYGDGMNDSQKKIIDDVFDSWAHPMIGNILTSPGFRPQTEEDQYKLNWEPFPEKHMSENTKKCINKMMESEESLKKVGLKKLTKTGRDQVRICKDMKELARSIIGEISTYATKKLEKIYALELCKSEKLFDAQKQLIKEFAKIESKSESEMKVLKKLFYGKGTKNNPLAFLEYLRFYFPSLREIEKIEMQWAVFVHLIECAIEDKSGLTYTDMDDKTSTISAIIIKQFKRLPPVIRCAMIINDIRKLGQTNIVSRYSISGSNSSFFKTESKFVIPCGITEAAGKDFIPQLEITANKSKRNIFIWSWTRDENHIATQTYRHFLMPLWAGPSGHATGLIEFYTCYISSLAPFYVSSVILASMFTFWRLYYDKRISGVHTLAETCEAAYSPEIRGEKEPLESKDIGSIGKYVNFQIRNIIYKNDSYEDAFDTLSIFPEGSKRTTIYHPNSIYIMEQVKRKHVVGEKPLEETVKFLDTKLNELRSILTKKGFEVPQWSKPLEGKDSLAKKEIVASPLQGITVKSAFEDMHVRTFGKKNTNDSLLNVASPSKRLSSLHDNLLTSKAGYNFIKDFPNLADIFIGTEMKRFLAETNFTDINNIAFEGDLLKFTASAKTDADFWKEVKKSVSVSDKVKLHCTVSDDKKGCNFTGKIDVSDSYKVTEKIMLETKSVIIESGLDENSNFPYVSLGAEITNAEDKLALNVTLPLGGNNIYISGEYPSEKVFSIKSLLSLFQIGDEISISSLLPADESILGELGLQEMSLIASTDPADISHIGFTITSKNPWKIFGDKITFQPYYEMDIENPFSRAKRQTDYTVLGKWILGGSEFDLIYRSDKTISAKLAEGSTLDFAKVAEVFAKNVKFPNITMTGMQLSADVTSGDYSLCLSATDIIEIAVAKAKIRIDDILLSLDIRSKKFDELKLSGTLVLAGLELNLFGMYTNEGISFKAMVLANPDYKLLDFANKIAQDLSVDFKPNSLPKEFHDVSLSTLYVSYKEKDSEFSACIDLKNVLKITDEFSIDQFAFKISSSKESTVEFNIIACAKISSVDVALSLDKKKDDFILSGKANFKNLKVSELAKELGIGLENSPDFIAAFAITELSMNYNITKKIFKATIITSEGAVEIEVNAEQETKWSITYKVKPERSVDLLKMPLIGDLVKKASPEESDFSVKDFKIIISSEKGFEFRCLIFGEQFPEKSDKLLSPSQKALIANAVPSENIKWLKLNKTIAMLTIPKVGVGLDNGKVILLIDASLDVKPFTFSVLGAGVGIDLSNIKESIFYMSGFGVSFDNGVLAIGGSFSMVKKEKKTVYSGMLLIKFKEIALAAFAEYSSGSIMAYFALSMPIGGPPAFFVKGLSLGFGYNKRLTLPAIDDVQRYPLITAAVEGFNTKIISELDKYIKDEVKQNFLTAGVKFTSFEIINGFLLLSVSFGNEIEISILGLADISVPPNIKVNPIAKAQLALKAALNPSLGFLSVEARLTSESYILSRDCKLTGGFSAFFWFGNNDHSGDFVVSLGGYHPMFQKPKHYPVVPRLGLSWNINQNLKIAGEIYFALTPSTLMAGGKLSAVYTQNNLKAWFIAYADFIIAWKPFAYDVQIGVLIGASYRVDNWFIHRTFSIETSATLHLWGPEVQGKVHVSWFIISFTISFSTGSDNSKEKLDWKGFKESFLADSSSKNAANANSDSDILSFAVEGIVGKSMDGTEIVDANSMLITSSSKIPQSGNVRPVNNAKLESKITLDIERSDSSISINNRFKKGIVTQTLPVAMWRAAPPASELLKEEATVKNAVCGSSLAPKKNNIELFPQKRSISLDELYKKNTVVLGNLFHFMPDVQMKLSNKDSIKEFCKTANSEAVVKRRQEFLIKNDIIEIINIPSIAEEAENWFSEEFSIKKKD